MKQSPENNFTPSKVRCSQRSMPSHATPVRVCTILREEQIRRTPVMGIKAEARRLSYIKHRRVQRNSSSVSTRSIHRGKRAWFNKKSRPPLVRNSRDEIHSEQDRSGVKWAKTVISKLSFNKLFKK